MRPGRGLNRLMTLEAPADAPDGGGGSVRSWTALGAVWAAVRAASGGEGVSGGAEGSRVTHRVELRWAPPDSPARPNAAQRLREGARVFRILAVSEADDRRDRLICWTEEGAER